MTIKTILFDFDGTLVNTNELIIATFLHTLNHYFPGKYERDDVLPFIGPTLRQTFSQMADEEQVDEMIQHYRKFNYEAHEQYIYAYPHVAEALTELKQRGIRLAIVTSKMSDMTKYGLQLTGLTDYFEQLIALDDVTEPKPHREPIDIALARLGVDRETAIMVGDNYHDIEAGQNAGIRTVAVGWALKGRDFLASYNPTWIVDSMLQLVTIVEEENGA